MSRYKKTFATLKKKKAKALIPFTVVGDPDLKVSLGIVKSMIKNGADVLELGIPFSDPVADGKTIQAADIRALSSGMDTDNFFRFIKDIRKIDDKIPIGVLVYANIVYQRGIEQFYRDAKSAGLDSVLVADAPLEESDIYYDAAQRNRVDTVFIVAPTTPDARIKEIAERTTGFIYVVARMGVTGASSNLDSSTLDLIKRVRKQSKKPICVGFGISKPEHVKSVCMAGADGAIVGSACVKIIEKNIKQKRTIPKKVGEFVKTLKVGTR